MSSSGDTSSQSSSANSSSNSSSSTSSNSSSTSYSSSQDSSITSHMSKDLLASETGVGAKISTGRRVWTFLPIGRDDIEIHPQHVVVRKQRLGCWPMNTDRLDRQYITKVEPRLRPFSFLGVLGNILACIGWGGLLHLIPAEIIGVSVSLGSSEKHRMLGVVWGGLAIFSFICLLLLRENIVRIRMGSSINTHERVVDVTVRSKEHGEALKRVLMKKDGNLITDMKADPGCNAKRNNLHFYIGLSTFVLLLANLIAVVILVKQCNDCGGCRDNGPPREGCFCC